MVATWIALLFSFSVSFILKDAPWFYDNRDMVSWYTVFFISCVFVVAMIFKHNGKKVDTSVLLIIFAGYFIRVFLLFWDTYYQDVFLLPSSGYDSESFYRVARGINPLNRDLPYSDFIAFIFRIIGRQRIIAQFINLLLGMSSVFIGLDILKKFTDNEKIHTFALLIGFLLPYHMILNVILLREAIIAFFIILSLYFFVKWLESNNILHVILSLSCILAAAQFHSAIVTIAIGYGICVILYNREHKDLSLSVRSITWIMACVLLFLVVNRFFDFVHLQGFDIEYRLAFAEGEGGGGADYSFIVDTGNVNLDFVINTPIRMVYFLMSPLPMYWRGPFDIIAFLFSSMFYGYTYYRTIRTIGSKDAKNRSIIVMLLIISLLGIFVFAWGSRNAGTAMRHRDKFAVQHVIMLALSLEHAWKNVLIRKKSKKRGVLNETV